MYFTIKSRNHGHIEFRCDNSLKDSPYKSKYIYVDLHGNDWWAQICEGGYLAGETIKASTIKGFKSTSRKWWNQWLRRQTAFEKSDNY